MSVRNQNILASNHTNWELCYQHSQTQEETNLNKIAALVGCTAAWPLFFLAGALTLTVTSSNYFIARWKQYKIINILSNPQKLEGYAERRIQCCEKQIENLKNHAKICMKDHLKNPNEVGLPIPQISFFQSLNERSQRIDPWVNFPWNEFLNTNFLEKSNNPNTSDKLTLLQLERARIKINFLLRQNAFLANPEGRLEAVKKIAEMSFVKQAFNRQESKEMTIHSVLWMLPSGFYWDLFLRRINARLTYEGNKNLLPTITNLQTYDDLLDAHNTLIRNNDFIVPYISNFKRPEPIV
ncbi:MAG: hypothetical protein H0V82_04125 [Candidatus Protochlamydia sp.]|nr:hypothetical protein [Candidatus Protochlamydia sp.]